MPENLKMPLLHDRHSHLSLYASLAGCPTLAGLNSSAALDLMSGLSHDRLHLIVGWHSGKTPLKKEDLDLLPPLLIVNWSLHGYLLSKAATSFLQKINPDLILRQNDQGWIDAHFGEVIETFPLIAGLDKHRLEGFLASMKLCGLGALDDMLVAGPELLHLIKKSSIGNIISCWVSVKVFECLDLENREMVSGIKLFTDGALGTCSAAASTTFFGSSRGPLLHTDVELMEILGICHTFRKALAIHAIGDLAIEQVLVTIEKLKQDGVEFPLIRIEHAQFITKPQAKRAKALGIILSMQPNFSSDSHDYLDRLDKEYLKLNNPFRMLIDEAGFRPGLDLIFGSDGMPHGVEYALQWSLFPVYPGQVLKIEEFIAGYKMTGSEAAKDNTTVMIDHQKRRVDLLCVE